MVQTKTLPSADYTLSKHTWYILLPNATPMCFTNSIDDKQRTHWLKSHFELTLFCIVLCYPLPLPAFPDYDRHSGDKHQKEDTAQANDRGICDGNQWLWFGILNTFHNFHSNVVRCNARCNEHGASIVACIVFLHILNGEVLIVRYEGDITWQSRTLLH